MRLIALRTMDDHPTVVPACEENLEKYQRADILRQQQSLVDIEHEISKKQKEIKSLESDVDLLLEITDRIKLDIDELNYEIDQGRAVDRTRWRGPSQPMPQRDNPPHEGEERHPRLDESAGHVNLNVRRRGVPEADLARCQVRPDRPVFPPRRTTLKFPGAGWRDDNEDIFQGMNNSTT